MMHTNRGERFPVLALLSLIALGFAPDGVCSPPSSARSFAGRTWAIEVPAGYEEVSSASPDARAITTGFTMTTRDDGTTAMFQVSLLDLRGETASPSFARRFGDEMIGGVQRRREDWKVDVRDDTLDGSRILRYEWSGVMRAPSGDRWPAKGIMLVGIIDGIGFSLHTQDVVAHGESVEIGERALRTFRILRP